MFLVPLIQLGVPLLLCLVTALVRQPTRLRWLVNALAYGMVIGYLLVSARWDMTSLYFRPVILVLFLAAVVASYRKVRRPEKEPGMLATGFGWVISLGLIVLMSGFLWFSLRGYITPDGAVDLASPLEGRNVVLNGGGSPFTNGHFRVRPQDHALDIVGTNRLGARAGWGAAENLDDYVIYGAAVLSPCSGTVVAAVDRLPDLTPPNTDPENPAGNHLLIACMGGFEVLLAHLQAGSLMPAVGEAIAVGDRIARVGNTGITSEPHLHIHAERGGEPGTILDGQAVPITIGGRYLVRNSRFVGPAG